MRLKDDVKLFKSDDSKVKWSLEYAISTAIVPWLGKDSLLKKETSFQLPGIMNISKQAI